jgi:hypothetical protein
MAQHVETGRILTGKEWRRILRIQAPYLFICVPPLGIVIFGLLIGAVILLIQVFLQPGKACSGGVA